MCRCGSSGISAYEQVELDERWCLVHATHADPEELRRIARSGAVVGLCPTTEANLGDGVVACRGDDVLNRWLFAGDSTLVRDVMVGGEWVVREGRHPEEAEAAAGFATALKG